MSILSGKHILLGITAGIAAYKTASLVRLFVKKGAQVKVVMTPASKEFITPLTLSTLSKNPVLDSFTNEENDKLSGKIITKISMVKNYCPAEEYHQKYLEKR